MIITKRLTIKNIDLNDKDDILEILTNEEVKQTYMIPDYIDMDKYIKLFERFVQLSNNSSRFVRGIFYEDRLIGFINDVEFNDNYIELGYALNPKFKNNGYMTEALKATINYLLNNGYDKVICGAFSFNIPSVKVMEKCGMKRTEKTDFITYRNKEILCIYYSIE